MIFTSLLSFAFSPIGRWLAGAAGIIAVLLSLGLYFDHKGASRIQARWDAANRAAAIAAQRRDEQAAATVGQGSSQQLEAAQQTINELSQTRDQYAEQLDAAEAARQKAEDKLRDKKCPAPRRGAPVLDQRGVDSLRAPAVRNAQPQR